MIRYCLTLKPSLKNIYLCCIASKCFKLFQKTLLILHIDDLYKNLKELLTPSLFPISLKENNCRIEKCNRKCDVYKHFLVLSTEFTCHDNKCKHKTTGFLTCNTKNIIYLIACKCCGKQYIGSATGFKERFGIHNRLG